MSQKRRLESLLEAAIRRRVEMLPEAEFDLELRIKIILQAAIDAKYDETKKRPSTRRSQKTHMEMLKYKQSALEYFSGNLFEGDCCALGIDPDFMLGLVSDMRKVA